MSKMDGAEFLLGKSGAEAPDEPQDFIETRFHYDDTAQTVTIGRFQDVEPILNHNKALQNFNDGYNKSRDMRRVASIPNAIAEQWMRDDGVNWLALPKHEKTAYLRKKLNSNEWRHLRTALHQF